MSKKEQGLPRLPRLPHSEAVNRRRSLAAIRKAVVVVDVNEKILETRQAQERLEYIGELLSPDNTSLSHLSGQELEQTRTALEIERIWLQLRIGVIPQKEANQLLTNKFGQLKQDNPDLYRLFVARSEYGLSMAQKIRDKVFPPLRVAGYHTKHSV